MCQRSLLLACGFHTGLTSTSFMKIHLLGLEQERERNYSSHCMKLFQLHLLLATKYITAIKNSQKPLNVKSIALDYYVFLREGIINCVDVIEYSAFSKEGVGREYWWQWHQLLSTCDKDSLHPSTQSLRGNVLSATFWKKWEKYFLKSWLYFWAHEWKNQDWNLITLIIKPVF